MSDTAQLIERLKNRYFGKYRGTVIDVDAPTMCVKASVPDVLGATTTGWCQPCVPYAGPQVGVFMLPDVGGNVWVEFEAGDVSYPIWTGGYWTTGDIPASASATVKSIITTAGTIAFDNNAGSITITGQQGQTITMDSAGITINAGAGNVVVGSSGVSLNNGALEVT
jgi:phage baseplate assembly protein gpV